MNINANAEEKERLRNEYRRLRAGISPVDRGAWNEAISRFVLASQQVQGAETFFLYRSFGFEVATGEIIRVLAEAGKRIIVPTHNHQALPANGFTELKFGEAATQKDGLAEMEIAVEARDVVSEIDLVLVPGIAWDHSGFRIGFGGGYFDRLLAMIRPEAVTVGLMFECQVVEAIAPEPWDKPVQFLATETGIRPAIIRL